MGMKIDIESLLSKMKNTIRQSGENIYDSLFKKSDDLNQKNLVALLQRYSKPSDFLNYSQYEEIIFDKEKLDNNYIGLYTLNDGRYGMVYKLNHRGYPTEKTQQQLESIIESLINSSTNTNGLAFNFTAFASQNIDDIVSTYKELHHCNVNVENVHILKKIVESEVKHIRQWAKKSCIDSFDYRIRNMNNLFSVVFPYGTQIEELISFHNLLLGSASSLAPEVVNGRKFIQLIYEMFNISKDEYELTLNNRIPMNKLIAAPGTQMSVKKGRVRFSNNIDKPTYADCFSIHSYPEDTTIFSTVNAFFDIMRKQAENPLPCPFVNSVSIKIKDIDKKREKYLAKAKWDYERLSSISVKDKKKEPELEARFRETKDTIDKLNKNGIFVDTIWNLTVLETDQRRLDKYGSKIIGSFKSKGWNIVKESFDNIALMKMLFTLPLQDDDKVNKLLNRTHPMLIEDVVKMIPLLSDNIGYGKPYVMYMSPSGQIQTFDPMASPTNYNIIVTGASGGGKSYSISKLLFDLLTAGTKIRMIDVGKSYANLCQTFGGQYIEFNVDSNYCLNFFTNVPTEKKIIEENGQEIEVEVIEKVNAQNIVAIIGIMAGISFLDTNGDEKDKLTTDELYLKGKIQEAVNDAFRHRGGRKADLRHVKEFLVKYKEAETDSLSAHLLNKLIAAMYNFADPLGSYYSYFNGPANIKFNSDFIVLELDELKDLKDLYPIVVFMIAQFSFNELFLEYHKNPTKRSLFGVDEAPMMFGNAVIVDLLEAFYRRIRKYNGIALTAAQGIPDFDRNKSTRAMFTNASWKIYNKVYKDDLTRAIKEGLISPTHLETQLLESINPNPPYYGELVIKTENSTMVSRLKTNPHNHWLLTQREEDKKIIEKAKRNYRLSDVDARMYIAEFRDSIDEDSPRKPEEIISYIKSLKSGKIDNEQVA